MADQQSNVDGLILTSDHSQSSNLRSDTSADTNNRKFSTSITHESSSCAPPAPTNTFVVVALFNAILCYKLLLSLLLLHWKIYVPWSLFFQTVHRVYVIVRELFLLNIVWQTLLEVEDITYRKFTQKITLSLLSMDFCKKKELCNIHFENEFFWGGNHRKRWKTFDRLGHFLHQNNINSHQINFFYYLILITPIQAYVRCNWQNFPSTKKNISDKNLNSDWHFFVMKMILFAKVYRTDGFFIN